MSDNVKLLWDHLDLPTVFRNIADDLEAGRYKADTATIIMGVEVFHVGNVVGEARSASNVIWDCNFAIAKLMRAATRDF